MLLEIALILLFICLFLSIYGIYNLLRKVEAYEDAVEIQTRYLQEISTAILEGKRHIEMLDSKGIYQADDEVGTFFEAIKVIQENLNLYAQEVENAEKKEE
jgi:hypothetical protein